jgi:hypothetical protein
MRKVTFPVSGQDCLREAGTGTRAMLYSKLGKIDAEEFELAAGQLSDAKIGDSGLARGGICGRP